MKHITLKIVTFALIISSCEKQKSPQLTETNQRQTISKTVIVVAEQGLILRQAPSKKAAKIAMIPNLSKIDVVMPEHYDPNESTNKTEIWLSSSYGEQRGYINSNFVYTPHRDLPSPSKAFRALELLDFRLEGPVFGSESLILVSDTNGRTLLKHKQNNLTEITWTSKDDLVYSSEFGDAGYSRLEKHRITPSTGQHSPIITITLSEDPSGQCLDNDVCSCYTESLVFPGGQLLILGNKKKNVYSLTQPYRLEKAVNAQGANCLKLTGSGAKLLQTIQRQSEWEYDLKKNTLEDPILRVDGRIYRISPSNGLVQLP